MGVAVPPPRPVAGQASAEYVALLAVVCAVVAGAAAVGSVPPIAAHLAGAVRHGICLVAGGICTPREARAAGLAPCLIEARAKRERLGGRVLVVKLGRGDSLLVQRRSDGSASVSFADDGSVGGSVGLGAQIGGNGASVRGGAGVHFTAGRTWEFPDSASAARFVRRWGRTETLTGELRGLWPGGAHPPRPDSTFKEGGLYSEFAAGIGLKPGAHAEARAELGIVPLGRRLDRDGRITWYHRVDGEIAGRLGLVLGALQRHDAGELVMETTFDGDRAVALRLRTAARVHAGFAPPGPATTLTDLAARLRGDAQEPGGAGRRLEAEVMLDLTDPANRRALRDVLHIAGARPADWDDRMRALADRLDADAAVDVRVLRVGRAESGLSAEASVGLGFGVGYERTEELRELERAWSIVPGGSWREREDCMPH